MGLRETLQRVLIDFPKAKTTSLEAHPLAQFIRDDAETEIFEALGELGGGLLVHGSPGQGNWAVVPWIAVFDPAVTTSATYGHYAVYLFHAKQPIVYLSLNQGTIAVREEFKSRTREVLADRAELIRKRVNEFVDWLPLTAIELGSDARLPGDYVAGHAIGVKYSLEALPDEKLLRADLQNMVRAYRALTYRGGVEGETIETHSDLADEFDIAPQTSVVETRKYLYHKKIERNRTAAKNAKKFHGTTCQACDLNFVKRYGEIGEGFIEAHHLRPIATLEEGVPVKYDVATEFAVLCANCHRMIHRTKDPGDLQAFKERVSKLSD
jgi:5-methylcytosine-specific restriction enzyme A